MHISTSSIKSNNHILPPILRILLLLVLGTLACASDAKESRTAAVPATGEESRPASSRSEPESGLKPDRTNPRYRICKGDTLELTFPLTPEFNQTVVIQPDGYAVLTGAGDIDVAGKTLPQVRDVVRAAYAATLHDPVISILVKDFVKPYFVAAGAVAKPGKYEMRDETTLTQAIAIAGGFTESSKHSEVLLFRRASGEWTDVRQLDVKKMYQSATLEEDLYLRPGDMLFVPQNAISKVKKWIPIPSISIIP